MNGVHDTYSQVSSLPSYRPLPALSDRAVHPVPRRGSDEHTEESWISSLPAEWHPHRRCWSWHGRRTRRQHFGRQEACKAAYAIVARAIASFVPFVLLENVADLFLARTLCGPAIEVRPVPIDDGWFRDNGPTFAIDGRGGLLGVNWQFNGWGGRMPCAKDQLAASVVLEQERIERIVAPLVLEGGSIHVDGEGTVLTTEECLLNPNLESAAQPLGH